jgi:DNA-binding LytR/AlgR family response regulator
MGLYLLSKRNELILVEESQIAFLEACGSYCNIHLISGEVYKESRNMLFVYNRISNKELFKKSHRSYLFNVNFITGFRRDAERGFKWSVLLENGLKLPASELYIKNFRKFKQINIA